MMQAIRDGAQGIIAWIIVLLLIVVFAMFGVQGYVGTSSTSDVAEVNGVSISERDFDLQYRNYRQQQRQQLLELLGNDVNNPLFKQLFNEDVMRQRVLDGMIQRRLLTLAALEAGFNVGDEQLNRTIRAFPAFQKEGNFNPDVYKQALRFQGMTSGSFKSRLQQDEVTAQFTNGLSGTVFVTSQQVENWYKLQDQTRAFGYVTLKAEDYRHQVSIDDEMIKAYYDNNTQQFVTDEEVTLAYVELSPDDIAKQLGADEQALKEFYEERVADYAVVDTSKQQATLNEARKRLEAGEDFAKLAKELSEDGGSANLGGEIGLIGRTDMEAAFADVAFTLKKGEVSEPVQTSFGMHIIKVNSIQDAQRNVSHILLNVDTKKLRTRPFEEVRKAVEKDYQTSAVDKEFSEKFQLLNNLSYEQPDTLEPVATELNLTIKTLGPITRRGGEGLAKIPAVVSAAFSTDVLAGNNSEPLELENNKVVVLRVSKHKEAAPKPLTEVNDAIIQRLLAQESQKFVKDKGTQLVEQLNTNAVLETLAESEKAKYEEASDIKRTDKKLPREVLTSVFAMPHPVDGKPVHKGVELVSGDYMLLSLNKVTNGDLKAATDEQKLAAKRSLQTHLAQREVTAMQADLRQAADIVLYSQDNSEPAVTQ